MSRLTFVVGPLAALAVACGDDAVAPDAGPPPVFPEDYAATYQEVRNCRFGLDHDLMRIRIVASPEAMAPYTTRTGEFPTGAILLKEEYDGGDIDCTGPITRFSAMQKLDADTSPETLDWTWQRVNDERRDVTEDVKRCVQCHTDCGQPPVGYGWTCSMK